MVMNIKECVVTYICIIYIASREVFIAGIDRFLSQLSFQTLVKLGKTKYIKFKLQQNQVEEAKLNKQDNEKKLFYSNNGNYSETCSYITIQNYRVLNQQTAQFSMILQANKHQVYLRCPTGLLPLHTLQYFVLNMTFRIDGQQGTYRQACEA